MVVTSALLCGGNGGIRRTEEMERIARRSRLRSVYTAEHDSVYRLEVVEVQGGHPLPMTGHVCMPASDMLAQDG